MITNIFVFAACDKCVYTNTYLFIFDEEVILSPTPVYYLPDPYFWRGDMSYKGIGTENLFGTIASRNGQI